MAKTYAKPLTPLTVKAIVSDAKKSGVTIKAPDGGGLYFIGEANRSSWWRFDYRVDGKQKSLSFGIYPDVTLSGARERRDKARSDIARGIDPGAQRKSEKIAQTGRDSFEPIAREWWERNRNRWTEGHAARTLIRLETDVFPYIGLRSIDTITAPDLLAVIRRIEARGAIETGHRTRQTCEAVFAYAIATGRCNDNPGAAIKKALQPITGKKNFARLKSSVEIAALLRAIEEYSGTHVVRCALRLAPLTFTRPGEIRQAEWAHIDLNKALWIVPSEVKKQTAERKRDASKVHLVPLSKQAIAILEEIKPLTGHGRYVFPSARSPKGDRPLSNVALLAALRRMGYSKEEMTVHGFRGIASTWLREAGKGRFRHEVIEAQLAHAIRNQVEAAYNHAEYMEERPAMMQWWADYLDNLKKGADVIPLTRPAA